MSALRQPTPPADSPPVAALPATSREVLDAVRNAYSFVDSADEAVVLGILATRPDVAAVLLDALPYVRDIFGDDTRVMLLSVDDPTEASLSLSARIVTSQPVPAARAKRDAFYQTFWLDVPGAIDEVLSFGLTWPSTT
jgi:hypothetical protein